MRTRTCIASLAPLLALAACAEEPPASEPTRGEVVLLSPAEHLVRASMALRGVRPSLDELERVDADPEALESIVDAYVDSPEFGRTMRELHDESLLLRPDWLYYPAGFPRREGLMHLDLSAINRAVMDAPLRLIEHVIANDRPYSEIVTADYAMTNAVSATVWGLDYDPSGPEWQTTRYRDGRGNAGILTDSWLYVRWQSTPSNANRQRANALSRALLCYDFLSRDVDLDTSVDTSDPNAVQSAVATIPECASCHQALDPLASFFKDVFPLVVPGDLEAYPAPSMWFPGVFEEVLGIEMRTPSYFGQPGESLEDLGRLIADDPRFSLCAAKRFYAFFNQVPLEDVPFERAAELQGVFLDAELDAKALAKAVVLSDDFRASHGDDDELDDLVGMRRARPDELGTMIEDLTGFVWATDLGPYTEGEIGRVDLASDSMIGYRVVGGGTDSAYVTVNTRTDNAATSLFVRGFAEEAAAHVVEHDFAIAERDERRLFVHVDLTTSDEAALRAQLVHLFARVFGELVDEGATEVDETLALFGDALAASDDPRRAWQTVLVAMLQDLRVTYY